MSTVLERAEEKLIGKTVRDEESFRIVGVIESIETETSGYTNYTVAVLDNGIRIKTIYFLGVK